jgi:hypothetical protein
MGCSGFLSALVHLAIPKVIVEWIQQNALRIFQLWCIRQNQCTLISNGCLVQEELIVKDTTKRGALAGAIAQRIRKQEDVFLMAKGPNAVANALSAVCRARSYLEVCYAVKSPLRVL